MPRYTRIPKVRAIPAHLFDIPNNWRGQLVLWFLRRYLNREGYRLTVYGRKPTKLGRGAGNGRPTLPRWAASRLVVYSYKTPELRRSQREQRDLRKAEWALYQQEKQERRGAA